MITSEVKCSMEKDFVNYIEALGERIGEQDFKEGFIAKAEQLDLGKQIAEIRQKKNLSKSAVAERIGMHRQNYARLEDIGNNTTIAMLERVARALDCKLVVDLVELSQTETASTAQP